jgi:putative ABC transport system permease protein
MTDLRYALRNVLHQPGFSVIVVITLALGIGATTGMFSVINTVLLRPLPYAHSDRLAVIWGNYRTLNIERLPAKAAEYDDYAKQTEAFDEVAAFANHSFNVSAGDGPERIRGSYVSANLFPMVEAVPIAGRTFAADDANSRVVILSYGYWQTRFGGSAQVLHEQLLLDNESYTIVGVMPQSFSFPHASFRGSEPAELWVPLSYTADEVVSRRGPYYLNVIGRLAAGVTLEQARSQMDALGRRFERELRGYRGPNGEDGGWRITVTPLQDEIVGSSRRTLLVLLFSVALLLLIACANVANLLLMRGAKRRKELAVRAALGASRWRITRQLAVESAFLTVLGASLGLVLAGWGTNLLRVLGPGILPRADELTLDLRVFAFAVAVALLISLAFGLIPLRQVATLDLRESLSRAGRGSYERPGRWSDVLVVAEVSLALLLLVGSGLLVKSLFHLQRVDLGVITENLLSVEVDLPATAYKEANQAANFYRELVQRIETKPGVQAVTFGTQQPLSGNAGNDPFAIEGRRLDPANLTTAGWQLAGPNFLQTLGIPLMKGRDFNAGDTAPGAPAVAIINQKMVARFWPNEDPIGRRITLGLPRPENPWVTIVGIAKDTPHRALDSPAEPDWYLSQTVAPQRHRFVFVRSILPTDTLTTTIRSEVAAIDPRQPLTSVERMSEVVAATTAPRRFNTLLLGVFAAFALVLAVIGIYGVVSYSVAQRTNEIGVRMALGASASDVLKLVLKNGMFLALIGVALGLAGAFALTRLMTAMLFEVKPTDLATFAIVSVGLILVALLACYLPARRAMKVDPLVALRYE